MKRPWTTRKQNLASLQSAQADMTPIFDLPPIGDAHLKFSISRNTSIALLISLLLHAIVLFFVLPNIKPKAAAPKSHVINITLLNPEPAKATEPLPEPVKPKTVEPKPIAPKQQKAVKKEAVSPKVIATPTPLAPQQTTTQTAPKSPDRSLGRGRG